MPAFTIRPAHKADRPSLLPLIQAYWQFEHIEGFDPARIDALLVTFLGDPALGRAWLAERDGACIGYLLQVFVFSFEYGGRIAEIDELFVHATARGQGIARALVTSACEALRTQCQLVQLQVANDNAVAQRLYARLGFSRENGRTLWSAPLGRVLPSKSPALP